MMCTIWHIWRQRNGVVFGEPLLHPSRVASRCVRDGAMGEALLEDRRKEKKRGKASYMHATVLS